MSATATRRATQTGGRNATTRHIPPTLALAVGMPTTPAHGNWRWSALTKLARTKIIAMNETVVWICRATIIATFAANEEQTKTQKRLA